MVNRYALLGIFTFLLLVSPTYASIDELSKATVGVSTSGMKIGTGVVVKETEDKYYILTAGHLVSNQGKPVDDLAVYFFHAGFDSRPIPAKIEYGKLDTNKWLDFAIISIDKEIFYEAPKVLQLGKDKPLYKMGMTIETFGLPHGQWPTGQRGHIFNHNIKDGFFIYRPSPETGRSGSAIINKDNIILGIVVFTSGQCMAHDHLYSYIKANNEEMFKLLYGNNDG